MTNKKNRKKYSIKLLFQNFGSLSKNTLLLLKQNFKAVILYALLCAAMSIVLTDVLKEVLLQIALKAAGMTFVSLENLPSFIFKPVSLICLFIFFFAVTLIALFEIGGMLHVFAMGQVGRDTDFSAMVSSGIRTCRKALKPANWFLILYMIVFLPLTQKLALSTSTFGFIIPEFIDQAISENTTYLTIYSIVVVLLSVSSTIWFFSLNIFVLQKYNFVESCRKSARLNKGHYLDTVIFVSILSLCCDIIINSLAGAFSVNLNDFAASFSGSDGILSHEMQVGSYLFTIKRIIRYLISPILNHAATTSLYFRYTEEKDMISVLSPEVFKSEKPSQRQKYFVIALLTFLVVSGSFIFISNFSFLKDPVETPLVVAHRGDNYNAPENTLEAFQLAAYENVKWVELDVHQTSDGVLVISHDDSMLRMTGQDYKIYEHTYDELKKLKFKSDLPGNYENVTIPTLKEVLEFCRDYGVNVQVEIKETKYDHNLEEGILAVINETKMHDNVLIICLHEKPLKRMKQLDPTIKVAYCMTLALNRIEDNEWSDWFSLEENNVTPELIHRLHQQGKKVTTWVSDVEDNIQYLVSCDVDFIGTDNPILIQNAIDKANTNGGLSRLFNILIHRFSVNN